MKTTENITVQEDDEFDLFEFCKRHLRASSWAGGRSQNYKAKELQELLQQTLPILKKQSSLAELSPPCTIVGDIHGQYKDLIRILNIETVKKTTTKNEKKKRRTKKDNEGPKQLGINNRYMFLGDYVDRGTNSLECICLLFSLKCIYPEQYMLLRGNHETRATNYSYGFRDELVDRLGEKDGIKLWTNFNDVFSWMPLAGLVGSKILCMHGGLSPHFSSLDDIRKIKRPVLDVEEGHLEFDLLWSDPCDGKDGNRLLNDDNKPQFYKNDARSCSYVFNEEAVKDCLQRCDLSLIVRAHQVQPFGYCFFADRKLITIFSAPKYSNSENKGSILKVSKTGEISIITFSSRVAHKGDNTTVAE